MLILLVDDEPQLIQQILADYGGYNVEVATDGQQAIQKITDQQKPGYDLIILDINMPILNGWQTLQFIRNNAGTADTYVIFLTSETEESSLIRGLRRGADEYLMKPLSPSRLLAHIDAVARRLDAHTIQDSTSMTDPGLFMLLTQREKELMKYVVEGLSNQKIAEKLVISETTVKNHLASVYRKWQVSNRNQAAFLAQKLKIAER